MPRNPSRAAQGGDVDGTTRIDVSQGEALEVASASFDPGYDMDETFEGGDGDNKMSKADLLQGFVSYGRLVGEKKS